MAKRYTHYWRRALDFKPEYCPFAKARDMIESAGGKLGPDGSLNEKDALAFCKAMEAYCLKMGSRWRYWLGPAPGERRRIKVRK